MRLDRTGFRHDLRQPLGHPRQILHARHHAEHLPAAEAFALQSLPDHQRVERHDEGAHRQTVHRRGGDDAHLTHAGQRQLQGARNRRCGQREHMHVRLDRFQPFLVRNAEMLLLIDDQQAKLGKLDRLRQQRMGADNDVDNAVRDALADLGGFLGGDHPRQLRHLDRQSLEAGREGAKMLPRQQRGRHHHRHLRAGHGGNEGGAQRHLGLAEADIAADQPVHRPPGSHVFQHVGDGASLVLGFGKREAGAEFVECAFGRRHDFRLADLPGRGDADQFAGHVANALLHPRFARLPAGTAQLVEAGTLMLAAVARQHLDVLNRQEQLLAAIVQQAQTVMRRAATGSGGNVQGDQTVIAADTVFLMHDQIALGDFRRFRDELIGPLAPAWRAGNTLAQQILLADNGQALGAKIRHEATLNAQRDQRNGVDLAATDLLPAFVGLDVLHPVFAQQMGDALARSTGPGGDD